MMLPDFDKVISHCIGQICDWPIQCPVKIRISLSYTILCMPVVPWGAGSAMAPPNFGRSVNPISTKVGRLCPANSTDFPGFSDLTTALGYALKNSITITKNAHEIGQNGKKN